MRSIEGEGGRVGTLQRDAACLPITLTLVRFAPSTTGSSPVAGSLPLPRERLSSQRTITAAAAAA